MRNILVECQPFDATTNQTHLIRLCSINADQSGTYLDNKAWLPVITGGPVFQYSLWQNGQPTALDISYGSLALKITRDFANLSYQGWNWSGAPASIWIGTLGQPFTTYRRIFTGSMGPIVPDTNNSTATISLLGPEADLKTTNLLSLTYAGTGGIEGPATLSGNLKPCAFGACTNVEPILIDNAAQIYQYHGYGSCALGQVYEGALGLGAPAQDFPDYASLYGATLTTGQWASCTALGVFRLGAQPTLKITADIGAQATVGAVVSALLGVAGVPASLIDPSVSTATRTYALYATDQAAVLDAIRDAALANERYLIADSLGVWHLASAVSAATPGQLRGDRSTTPLVLTDQVKKEAAASPIWRLKVGHTRVWSVLGYDDVAGGVVDMGADITAAQTAADNAQKAADAAAVDAGYAKARLVNQASDGVIDRTEKLQLIHAIEGYSAEKNGIISAANAAGVSGAAYANAYTAYVTNYLATLTPAYTDVTQDTPVTSQYVTLGTAFINARSALLNATASAATQLAQWGGVTGTGKPQDYATVGATAGVNLADGSGNTLTTYDIKTSLGTSADTANVAGRPSTTVLQQIDSATAAAQADTTPPAIPAAPTITSAIDPKSGLVTVTISWAANTDADLASYIVMVAENAGGYVGFPTSTASYVLTGRLPNIAINAKVAAVDKSNNVSGYSAVTTAITVRDTTPPAPTSNINVSASLGGFFVTWTNPGDADLAGITVYQSPDSNFANATIAGTTNAQPSLGGSLSITSAPGTTQYFWTQAFDTSGNKSGLNGPFGAYIPSLTLDASKLTGTISTGQLSGQTVASVLASSGLTPPLTIYKQNINDGSVTAIAPGQTAYNEFDGQLYRNADGNNLSKAWLPVYTDAASITGQIVTTQITDSAVTSLKLAGKSVIAGKLDADAVTAGTIAAAAISSRELQADSVTATKLAVVGASLFPDGAIQEAAWWTSTPALAGAPGYQNPPNAWYVDTNPAADSVGFKGGAVAWVTNGTTLANSTAANIQIIAPSVAGVIPGESYEAKATFNNATNRPSLYMGLQWFRADGTYISQVGVSCPNDSTVRQLSVQGKAPADAIAYRLYWDLNGSTAAFSGGAAVCGITMRQCAGGTLIVDGTIQTNHLSALGIDGSVIKANTLSAGAIKSTDSLPGSLSISGTGFSLSTLSSTAANANSLAANPASQINANSTLISPGKVQLQGGTTLSSILYGGDNTLIDGGKIATNTITANQIAVGLRGITWTGLQFDTDRGNNVSWTAGTISCVDNSSTWQTYNIAAGSASYGGSPIYIWWPYTGGGLLSGTTHYSTASDVQIAVWNGGTGGLNVTYGQTIVDGANIKTGTVTADRIATTSLSAMSANLGSITAGILRSPGDTTYLDFGGNYFRFAADQFVIHSPGNVINPVFTWNGSSLQLRNVAIDGGTINVQSINTAQLTVGGVTTDRIADRNVSQTFVLSSGQSFGGTGSSGGTGGGGGGGGGSCPEITLPVLLANEALDGPGTYTTAGELRVGEYVWTQHETTMEWGAYRVLRARKFEAKLWCAGDLHRGTFDHPIYLDGRWVTLGEIGVASGRGIAVAITVDDAHTFVGLDLNNVMVLNHNKVVDPE